MHAPNTPLRWHALACSPSKRGNNGVFVPWSVRADPLVVVARTDLLAAARDSVSGGTAVSGTDYSFSAGTLTFAPGVTAASFTVTLLDDGAGDSSNETLGLVLNSVQGGATLGMQSQSDADAVGAGAGADGGLRRGQLHGQRGHRQCHGDGGAVGGAGGVADAGLCQQRRHGRGRHRLHQRQRHPDVCAGGGGAVVRGAHPGRQRPVRVGCRHGQPDAVQSRQRPGAGQSGHGHARHPGQ